MSIHIREPLLATSYRYQIPIDPSQQPLVRCLINVDDFALMASESFHSLVGIVRMLQDVFWHTSVTDGICQWTWEVFLNLRVNVSMLFVAHIRWIQSE
jgi:hypothetical protein